MEIVTGATGAVHVTPIDDAVRNGNVGYVDDKVVFTYYNNLSASAITANEVRIFAGYGMNQGRLFKIPRNTYDSVVIENGAQGYKRADLIVARYTMDSQTGFESISLVVIKGQSGDSYVDPSYTEGDINSGEDLDDFPLYRVKINGMQIEEVEPLFTLLPDGGRVGEIEEDIEALEVSIVNLNNSKAPNNHASDTTTYGKGTDSLYGHLKLSDATNSTSGKADGIAATPKAVKDAKDYVLEQMGQAGYGDMMSEVYTGSNGAIIQEKGGTGSTDGSINGVKLAKSGNTYGYMDGNTFKSFRQPTGNATSAQVLSGYTFANASSDAVNGGMSNYSGNNRRTVTPAAGRNTQTLSIAAGYHDSVNVNTATVYDNAKAVGVAEAQAVTWTQEIMLRAMSDYKEGVANMYADLYGTIPLKNVTTLKCTELRAREKNLRFYNSSGSQISSITIAANQTISIPSGTAYAEFWGDLYATSTAIPYVKFSLTYQAKILR